ncbi:MAG: cell division ATP-binding protein FtsE [Patescibacteria group bacterium]|nr:cell division ATP-binding protein FtsE [Patescibacteria group bacterium]
MKLINLESVTKEYPDGFVALENINCEIDQGEFVSLVGSSGSGKTTLLKMIYADEFPSDGAVYFGGRNIGDIKRKVLPHFRRNFGTVFQDFKLLPQKSVFENIAYTLEVHGKSDAQITDEVMNILRVVGMENKADKYPHQISGGEQQRVSLARAVIHRPRVLIADEPTGNLDPISALGIVRLLLKVNSFGTTVILATHDKSVVDKLSRRVILMDKGQIMRDDEHGKYIISG